MALFGKKTEKKVEQKPSFAKATEGKGGEKSAQDSLALSSSSSGAVANVLKHARITEKASMQQGNNVYSFDVASSATKRDIMLAVRALYGVKPRKVAVVNVPTKTRKNMRTGRAGLKRGGKKAYVYLKSGETITAA